MSNTHNTHGTRKAAGEAFEALQTGVANAVEAATDADGGTLQRTAAQVEEFTRRGIERARETSAQVSARLARAGDRGLGFVREQPVKSVVIAAATGAAVAALVSWAVRSRASRH